MDRARTEPRQLRSSCRSVPCEPSRPLFAASVDAAVQGAASFRCPRPRLGCRSVFGLRGVAVARLARHLRRPKLAYVDGGASGDARTACAGGLRQLPFQPDCLAGVWACASLLHLDRDQLVPAVSDIRNVLVSRGALFVSLKYGSGEGWETSRYGPDAPRWFTYWSEDDLDSALLSAGFEILESATQAGLDDRWIARIARRNGAF